jgi:CRP-like cAMP-binding protein
MNPLDEADAEQAAIVSCDIVGHSTEEKLKIQVERVAAINTIVAETIKDGPDGTVVWTSGGDGGHVILRRTDWRRPAVALINRLRTWSRESDVPLRVTAHVGPVTDISGADGRIQVIGDGINVAGWLLSRGGKDGVVVSEAFQRSIGTHSGVRFHAPRQLRNKRRLSMTLMLMSTDHDRSQWDDPVEEEQEALEWAGREGSAWEVIYHAKRILQVNQGDTKATSALRNLRNRHFTSSRDDDEDDNDLFFEHLGSPVLREIVQHGQLVERRYNEVICRFGDKGNTMFVILKGQVGVYKSEGEGSASPAKPAHIHQEGEVVGELAFALARDRTADLIALSDTALLSFNYDDIVSRLALNKSRSHRVAQDRLDSFITYRVLEHVSHNVPYLLGHDRSGPLAQGEQTWKDTLSTISDHCALVTVPPDQLRLEIETVLQGHGLYVLASGELRSSVNQNKAVTADGFPLLWVSLPNIMILPHQTFDIVGDAPVRVLYVGASALSGLEVSKRAALYAQLRRAASSCFDYDAFIAHNSRDLETTRRWTDALRDRGLQVFMDISQQGSEFPPRLLAAIRHSRALVPLISPHVNLRDRDRNWVIREIDMHLQYFDNRRVYPVVLPGGTHEGIVTGFPPIEVGEDDEAAIDQLATELLALRDGAMDPPYALRDRPEPAF